MSKEYNYYSIMLNQSNIVQGSNNSILKYEFDNNISFKDSQIALSNVNMYYSWFNISKALGNNVFSYKWFSDDAVGELNTVYTIEFDDGYYDVNTMNEYMQSKLVSRGHYVVDSTTTNYIYYMEFVASKTYYSIQLNVYAMRTSDGASGRYSKGLDANNAITWNYPATPTYPQIIFNSTSKFNDLIGFSNEDGSNVYPVDVDADNDGSSVTYLSSKTPKIEQTSSIVMLCSLATQDGFTNPDNIIYSFTPAGASFGGIIEKSPVVENYVNIRDGTFKTFTIEMLNQDLERIKILDPQMLVTVNIRVPKEKNI